MNRSLHTVLLLTGKSIKNSNNNRRITKIKFEITRWAKILTKSTTESRYWKDEKCSFLDQIAV